MPLTQSMPATEEASPRLAISLDLTHSSRQGKTYPLLPILRTLAEVQATRVPILTLWQMNPPSLLSKSTNRDTSIKRLTPLIVGQERPLSTQVRLPLLMLARCPILSRALLAPNRTTFSRTLHSLTTARTYRVSCRALLVVGWLARTAMAKLWQIRAALTIVGWIRLSCK